MPHAQPKSPHRSRRKAACALLLAAGAAFAAAGPAVAQSADDPLALKAGTAAAGDASDQGATDAPVYQPLSQGAVPDAPDPSVDDGGLSAGVDPLVPAAAAPPPPASADDTPAGTPARKASAAAADPDAPPEPANPKAGKADDDREPLDSRAVRTGAIETPRVRPEDDPFAPVGVPFGTFVLRPSIEQGLTATDNADGGAGGRSAVLSETTLRLNATSDWAQNSATIDAAGSFRESLSGESLHDARGSVDGTLNLDLEHDWRLIAKAGYEIAPESASSPVDLGSVASQPTRQSVDGSLALQKDIGKLRFGLTGAASHDGYGDARLSDGSVLSQKDRNETLYTATLRGGYEVSPALTPFAELEVGRRVYDQRADAAGYQRSADRLGIRAGTELDLGEKLNGEVSAGWIREKPDDGRLAAISGASVAAGLKWSPERGTIIGLDGSTTVEGTTTAGETGSLLYSGRLTAERRIRSDLTANAALGLGWRDYVGTDGHDLIFSAEAGLTWWMNRYVGLTTRARYEKLDSNIAGRNYDATSVFAGIKVQR